MIRVFIGGSATGSSRVEFGKCVEFDAIGTVSGTVVMPKTRLRFSTVNIIESLPADHGYALRTGYALFQEIQAPGLASVPCVDVRHFTPRTKSELLESLAGVGMNAQKSGELPLLHLECHGGSDGVAAGSGELVQWEELRDAFTAINRMTRMNLLVFLAACQGVWLIQLLQPSDRAPFRCMIGPNRPVFPCEIEGATMAFYRTVFAGRKGDLAVEAMNAAVEKGDSPFKVITAESAFRTVLAHYRDEQKKESVMAARRRRFMAQKQVEFPSATLEQHAAARGQFESMLRDERWQFEWAKNRFFFDDMFPEVRAQLEGVSFEECSIDRLRTRAE